MAQCASTVPKLYKSIIEEIISNVKDEFLDEGIDEQVLLEVKQAWEQKLAATRATDHNDGSVTTHQQLQQSTHQQVASGLSGQAGTLIPPPQSQTQTNLVPVQITVPAQQAGGTPKTITIHVPSSALANGVAGAQLQNILSAPAAAQTFALEAPQAADVIQRQLNAALQRRGIVVPQQLLHYTAHHGVGQVDGPVDHQFISTDSSKSRRKQSSKGALMTPTLTDLQPSVSVEEGLLDSIVEERLGQLQVDGALDDSSDEMSGDDDDDDEEDKEEEDDKDKKFDDDDDEEDATDGNEDPLNSNDDVSDDDSGEAFETDNVVVCQYDKVTRVRNKWRFNLKDGIMNLKGKDYVFLKATGEGEW